MTKLDKIDLKLINLVQREGRLTIAELAERVNLSATPCARRIKRLEDTGLIEGYRADIDRKKAGFDLTIFISVRLSNHREKAVTEFESAIQGIEEVVSAHTVSGASDYLLEVISRDLAHYEKLMKKLQTLNMVQDINSNFAIRSIKHQAPLPVSPL